MTPHWQLWGFCDFPNHATTQGRSGSTIPKRVAMPFSYSRFSKSLEATNTNSYLWELQCYIVWIVTAIKSWRENLQNQKCYKLANPRTHEPTNQEPRLCLKPMKQQTHEPDVNILKGQRLKQHEGLSTHVPKSWQWWTRTRGAAHEPQWQVEWGGETGLLSLSDEEEREKKRKVFVNWSRGGKMDFGVLTYE